MSIFENRPFKVRNAEEYDLNQILELFVNPSESNNPFEYENSIIKGRMGSGKTMYLKSNYVFYLYSIVPSLVNKEPLYLPVFLRLNDFQHLIKPEDIYRAVIVNIVQNISKVYLELQDYEKMALIHQGMKTLPPELLRTQRLEKIMSALVKLDSNEYSEIIKKNISISGNLGAKFIELSSKVEKEILVQIKKKPNPGISDVKDTYDYLLRDMGGKLLLLIDEAGALDKSFFKSGPSSETSFFEILMNQLRTSDFIRTKIAVYPNSYSDILAETRYGDVIMLSDNVIDAKGCKTFRKKAISLINNYLTNAAEKKMVATDVFNISMREDGAGDCLEQLINATEGNLRRLVQLLDLSMQEACEENGEESKVGLNHALKALEKQAFNMESLYSPPDREFLETIAKACRNRSTFRFGFPSKSPVLSKYISKSEEQNLLQIIAIGAGRRGTTYAFDYAYCVLRDIPTHFLKGTERIDKERSRKTGNWSKRVVKISEGIMAQASLPGKIEGEIAWLRQDSGFVKADNGKEYFVTRIHVIPEDRHKPFMSGQRIRFFPGSIEGSLFALGIEIL